MKNTIKAVRATLTLGDIELDVFQLPDGSYRMSQTQILETINIEPKRYTEIRDSKVGQSLGMPTFDLYRIELENKAKANTFSIEDVPKVWRVCHRLKRGNLDMLDSLLDACLIEALERRADASFNVKRTEEERNERLKVRKDGKIARRTLTDSIKDYCENHDVSDNYKTWVYSNCSDYLNKIILGAKAKQAKDFYQIPEDSLLRNHIPVDALRELALAENLASRFIDERDMECLTAVKEACKVAFVKYIGLS